DLSATLNRDLVSVLCCQRFDGLDHAGDQRREREGFELQLHPPGLNLGEVEDVVDQREQVATAPRTRSSGSVSCFIASESSRSISLTPMMALSGVRSSWLILARNCDLWWLASASCRLLSWVSSNNPP